MYPINIFIVWVYRIVNPVIMFQCSLFLYVVYIFTLLYAEFNGNGFGQSHYFFMPCLFARRLCLVFFSLCFTYDKHGFSLRFWVSVCLLYKMAPISVPCNVFMLLLIVLLIIHLPCSAPLLIECQQWGGKVRITEEYVLAFRISSFIILQRNFSSPYICHHSGDGVNNG